MSPTGFGPPPAAAVPPRAPLGPPYSPSAIINLNLNNSTNMSGNSLTDALILLSGAYLSVVQPAAGLPKVGLFTFMPKVSSTYDKEIVKPFEGVRKAQTLKPYGNVQPSFDVSSAYAKSDYTPKQLLEILCDDVFPRNTISVFYLNNAEAFRKYDDPTVEYLPQIISSLGLPIISYDTQFSFNRRTPMSIQLAPTMGQMMDVLFAFLKKYNWTDFSFLCTLSMGCLDEIATIRLKVEESQRRPTTTKYGVEMFSFKLLSNVNFTNGQDQEEVEEKLRNELDRDTRVILVHGRGSEVKDILDVAKRLRLTGKEYVWIFTMACITIGKENAPVAESYPLGSFVIGFDSKREHMPDVMKNVLDIWLQALDSLAGSADMDEVDFDTEFSCDDEEGEEDSRRNRRGIGDGSRAGGGSGGRDNSNNATAHYNSHDSMRWKYGEILYKHLLKAKLRGDIEFDQYGILKSNKFWIRNIQYPDTPSRSSGGSTGFKLSSNRGSSSSGGSTRYTPPRRQGATGYRPPTRGSSGGRVPPPRRPTSDRSRFSGGDRDRSSGISSSSRARPSGISRDRDSSSGISRDRFSGSSSSSRSRDEDRTRSRSPSGNSPPSSRNRNFRRPGQALESRSLRTSAAKSFLRRPDNINGRINGHRSDEERQETDARQTTMEPPGGGGGGGGGGGDSFVVGQSNPSKSRYRITSSTDETLVGYYDGDVGRRGGSGGGGGGGGWRGSSSSSSSYTDGSRRSWDQPKRRRRPGTSPSAGSKLFGRYNQQEEGQRGYDRNGQPMTPVGGGGDGGYGRNKRYASRSKGRRAVAKKIASWDGRELTVHSITWPGGESKPPKGKPEKYVLRVATWHEDPHVIFVNPDNTTGECDSHSLPCNIYVRDPKTHVPSNMTKEVCCSGLAMDLLKRLSEELHIDVDLQEARLGAYGSALDANLTTWTGLMGMLTRNEADLAMAAMSITPERSAAVEFSMPFLQTGITIIVAIRAGVISPTAFLEPYDYLSWTLILVFSVHATGTSIFIFEWLSPYGLDHGKTPLSVHKFSLFRSFWLIWAMLFGASVSTDMPRGCASRFLANIWALFAVVFCASYTANLAAFMITKDDFYDLSGIQDWRLRHPHHRQPPFKFATITNSSTDTNIRKNYPQIFSFMSEYGQYDVKEAIESLKNQDIQAFIYDSTTLEYEVGKDVGCKLKTVGKRIAETGYGVAFPKKSQWTKKFNVALLRLQEDGEIERIQKFWLAGACHKKKEGVGVSSHTLGILNFTSAFILLGGGIIIGAVLLTLEHMYFRFGRKQLKKWDKYGCCSLVSLSMGQSLTFERSVMEAIDFHKHHKCKDPICETQLWKVKHELDLALLKIAQLRKQIAHTTSDPADGETTVAEDIPRAQAVGGEDIDPTPSEKYHNGATAPRRRRQTKADEAQGGQQQSDADNVTKSLLHGGGDSDEEDNNSSNKQQKQQHYDTTTPTNNKTKYNPNNNDDSGNNYSLLQEPPPRQNGNNIHHHPNNQQQQQQQHPNNKPKAKPKPPPRNSSYAPEPELKPAVKPRPPTKRPHEKSSHAHAHAPSSRDNAVTSRDRDDYDWPPQPARHAPQQPQQYQQQQPQQQPQQHQPHGNKIHPKRDDLQHYNNLQQQPQQPAQQSFPDPRSNNNSNNNTTSPTSQPDPILSVPPPPTYDSLSLNSPTADGTAPPSSSDPRASAPSPPLPPPPTPPPIIDNIQDPCSTNDDDSPISSPASSRPASWNPDHHLYERAGAITPGPHSSSSMYEPVPLDPPTPGYHHPSPSSPSSPTSSSSQTSHNPPLSPGGVSELSNEGMSLPSSPDRLSYSSDTNPNLNTNNNNRNQQGTSSSPAYPPSSPSSSSPSTSAPLLQGNTNNTTNPFSQQSPDYSNSSPSSSLDNQNSNSSSEPNSVVESSGKDSRGGRGRNGDVASMTSLKEADNDVDTRRGGRSDDGNVYVNVDDSGGKETTF